MRTISEINQAKFNSLIHNFLINELTAKIIVKNNIWRTEYQINTLGGLLNIFLHVEHGSMFSVFTKFENPKFAAGQIVWDKTINDYTGKWNFHLSNNVEESFAEFSKHINQIKL